MKKDKEMRMRENESIDGMGRITLSFSHFLNGISLFFHFFTLAINIYTYLESLTVEVGKKS